MAKIIIYIQVLTLQFIAFPNILSPLIRTFNSSILGICNFTLKGTCLLRKIKPSLNDSAE